MAGSKEIRNQIASIKSTQKITKAMEMVAGSRMRKAQDRMQAARPYAEKIRRVIAHLYHASVDYKHPLLVQNRERKRVGYIVVSSNRGLCGGLNSNLFRLLSKELATQKGQGIEYDFCTVGNKALGFCQRVGGRILGWMPHPGDTPHVEDLIGTVKVMLDAFEAGELDAVCMVYNRFVNTMIQQPTIEQLVPIHAEKMERLSHYWEYIYEPDPEGVIDHLLVRYIESLVYQAVVENGACAQSARMVAMKAATDNATNLISELQLLYNKARQAAITQEISEIVGGAAAV
jgi:F-type H+-transporting ATPase subunit gamma